MKNDKFVKYSPCLILIHEKKTKKTRIVLVSNLFFVPLHHKSNGLCFKKQIPKYKPIN